MQLLLNGAAKHGAKRIRLHVLTDGRDVLDGSSVGFAETLENELAKLREKGVDAQVASGGGRMYVTMDRYEVLNSMQLLHWVQLHHNAYVIEVLIMPMKWLYYCCHFLVLVLFVFPFLSLVHIFNLFPVHFLLVSRQVNE